MSLRRMLPFILINIVVSAVVVLALLFWWENRDQQEETAVLPATTTPATISAAVAAAATAVQATETPPPADEPLVHVVQQGDTLGSISQFYEVPMDDIIAVNDIANPNVLSAGQELVIPVGGLPTVTPAPTDTPAADVRPSPIPTAELLDEGEVMVEITAVTGAGNLTEEAVQISNLGSRQIALLDWQLADADGHLYSFGQVTLFGDGAAIQVHTESGDDGPADLYWGLEEPIWETGERVTLLDADDTIVATFTVP